MIVPFLEEFLDFDEHSSHASAILFFYGKNGNLDFSLALKVSAGGVIGGFLGAKLLKKLSGRVIRIIFGSFMIIAAIRMFFA